MKKFGLLGCVVVLLLLPVLSAAETTDGLTPAEETICDPLKQDGVTKGLYGLCVAFCEAQDWASELSTMTPEEVEAMEFDSPSGRILANYNKKKQESDPGMPCIVIAPPCPCFSQEELQSIDGFNDVSGYSIKYDERLYVDKIIDPNGGDYITEAYGGMMREYSNLKVDMHAATVNAKPGRSYVCSYVDNQKKASVSRSFRTDEGTLSMAEWEACRDMIVAEIDAQPTPKPEEPKPLPEEPMPILEPLPIAEK